MPKADTPRKYCMKYRIYPIRPYSGDDIFKQVFDIKKLSYFLFIFPYWKTIKIVDTFEDAKAHIDSLIAADQERIKANIKFYYYPS